MELAKYKTLPLTLMSTLLDIMTKLVAHETVTVWSPAATLLNMCPELPDEKFQKLCAMHKTGNLTSNRCS